MEEHKELKGRFGDKVDGITLLQTHHREIEDLFENFMNEKDRLQQIKILNEITRQLSMHLCIEELYLYPLLIDIFPQQEKGTEIQHKGLQQHKRLREIMQKLEILTKKDEVNIQWDKVENLMKQIMEETRDHIREKESKIFPKIRQIISDEKIFELGAKIEQSRRFAVTHPHRYLPSTPPLNKLITPIVGIMDRVEDKLYNREFPKEKSHPQHTFTHGVPNLDEKISKYKSSAQKSKL